MNDLQHAIIQQAAERMAREIDKQLMKQLIVALEKDKKSKDTRIEDYDRAMSIL